MCPWGGTLASSSIFAKTYPTIFPGQGRADWVGFEQQRGSATPAGGIKVMFSEKHADQVPPSSISRAWVHRLTDVRAGGCPLTGRQSSGATPFKIVPSKELFSKRRV